MDHTVQLPMVVRILILQKFVAEIYHPCNRVCIMFIELFLALYLIFVKKKTIINSQYIFTQTTILLKKEMGIYTYVQL